MKLPPYHVKPVSDAGRKMLAEWLAERRLDLQGGHCPAAIDPAPLRYDQRDVDVRAGEVLIVRPPPASAWGPVYVLALERSSVATWLMIPFGRYATPAVPGEWKSGLSAMPVRVLCFWNARVIPSRALLPGQAKKLTEIALEKINAVYRHVSEGAPIGGRLAARLGPPLIHPADPRYEYLEEERRRLDEHLSGFPEQKATETLSITDEDAGGPASWLLAAEGRPRWPHA